MWHFIIHIRVYIGSFDQYIYGKCIMHVNTSHLTYNQRPSIDIFIYVWMVHLKPHPSFQWFIIDLDLLVLWYVNCQLSWEGIDLSRSMPKVLISIFTKLPMLWLMIPHTPMYKFIKMPTHTFGDNLHLGIILEKPLLDYFFARTGPDFMQPIYTRGFVRCRANVKARVPNYIYMHVWVSPCNVIHIYEHKYCLKYYTNVDMHIIIHFHIILGIPCGDGSSEIHLCFGR